jgi:hypothetical protein
MRHSISCSRHAAAFAFGAEAAATERTKLPRTGTASFHQKKIIMSEAKSWCRVGGDEEKL